MSAKDEIIEAVRRMADDAAPADILAELGNRFGMPDDEWDAAYVEEINRRVEGLRNGTTKGIPHEEVMRQAKEKYG